ncbi:MAG: hypothetical protein U0556_09725 [Dehalococcoidia bacterium]
MGQPLAPQPEAVTCAECGAPFEPRIAAANARLGLDPARCRHCVVVEALRAPGGITVVFACLQPDDEGRSGAIEAER